LPHPVEESGEVEGTADSPVLSHSQSVGDRTPWVVWEPDDTVERISSS
jgi:hypothetical protein